MNRLPAVVFALLAAATVGAFFVVQHLKVSTPLIAGFPAPYPSGMTPWNVRYSMGWSSVWTASRRFPAASGGPCGTANDTSTPRISSRTSQCRRVA